ncbi:hypothetical protein [Modestobacter sp. KNN46-3]|jgi:STE24 endopeptidase|uniref:hypothetical protein n=1 Tax=Modestobacter sp. KNN46-3 TaxID=2711218 RepID=UPI0013DEAF9E|nr:hypothetical protein [Modestobacter sp. KNN46-3]
MVALLVHELGHHATRATQPMLVAVWLAAPWRMTARVLTGLAGLLSGHPSQRALRTVVISGITVAVVRVVQQGQWMVGGVLGALALFAVICPLADATVCRRAEFAADRFAADHGIGPNWPPRSAHWAVARVPPSHGRGGWHPTRPTNGGSARS